MSPRLEPTVPASRRLAPTCPGAVVVADTLVRLTTAPGRRGAARGTPRRSSGRLEPGTPRSRERRGAAGPLRGTPPRRAPRGDGARTVKRAHRGGDVFQCAPSQWAHHPRERYTARAHRAPRRVNRRRTCSSSSSTESRSSGRRPSGSSPARAVCASLRPIAGTTEPTEGDVERLAASENARAEHVMLVDSARDDLSRVCVAVRRTSRDMEVGRSPTSRTSPRRSSAHSARASARRRRAGVLSGGNGLRRPQSAGDAADLRARGVPPGPRRGRGRPPP